MKKAEKAHMARVAELGCLICGRPAELHHPRQGAGMSRRANSYDVIPLCPDHHRNGGYGVAIHAGRRGWQEKHGTETRLLEKVRGLL